MHSWAHFLKQQTLIVVCRLPTKENKLPLSGAVCSKQTEVFHFLLPFATKYILYFMYLCSANGTNGKRQLLFACHIVYDPAVLQKKSNRKKKTEDQAISHNPFSICSSFKRKFVVCQSGDKETNRCYPFANGLNGLNRVNGLNVLAYL
jgi:hypothetical protein